MPFGKRWNSKKKKENKQQLERQTEKEKTQQLERQMESEERLERSSQNLNDRDFDHYRWYSTGDIDRRTYRFNSLPFINKDAVKKLMETSSRSQERMDWMEQQTLRLMQNQDYTNTLIESLVKKQNDDLFYKNDYDECEDDLISEAPHKNVVRESLLDIKDNLDTEYILDELYTKHAIDFDERQSVQGQKTDAAKSRSLVMILEKKPPSTFETFLSVLNKHHSWLYEVIKRKYEVAKRDTKSKCCHFCYVCNNTDVRKIADEMYKKLSFRMLDYKYLVNDGISEAGRWQTLREITPKMSEARNVFINALQDLYPVVREKIQFTKDTGTLLCTCSSRHMKTSKPRTIKKRPGAKIASDIKAYLPEDDQDTIDKFLREENASIAGSDSVPDIEKLSAPSSTYTFSPKVEASPIIRHFSTSGLNGDKNGETINQRDVTEDNDTTSNDTEKRKVETNDVDRYKYLSVVLGLVVLLLFLMIMTHNGMTGYISFVKDVPHRILDTYLHSNTKKVFDPTWFSCG